MRIVVIGNSAASTAAIEAIRELDAEIRIVQLASEAAPLYARCLLSYYIAGTIDAKRLPYRAADFQDRMTVELHAGPAFRVIDVEADRQRVRCQGGATFAYDSLILCTGASAVMPPGVPASLKGVHSLRNIADAEAIRRDLKKARAAVVLGGGLIGIKAATALRARGLPTTMIVSSGQVLSRTIDAAAAALVHAHLRALGIEVLLSAGVTEVLAEKRRLSCVRTDTGADVPCDLLVCAKGVTPNLDMLGKARPHAADGIRTDPHMRTSFLNVYAAGDAAEPLDVITGRHARNALWTCAVQQGRIAGLAAAGSVNAARSRAAVEMRRGQGRPQFYTGALGMNSVTIGSLPLSAFGMTSPPSGGQCAVLSRSSEAGGPAADALPVYRKVVIGPDSRIKGAILLGNISNAGVILSLIRNKVDVSDFQEELLDDDFAYGRMLAHAGEAEKHRYASGTAGQS